MYGSDQRLLSGSSQWIPQQAQPSNRRQVNPSPPQNNLNNPYNNQNNPYSNYQVQSANGQNEGAGGLKYAILCIAVVILVGLVLSFWASNNNYSDGSQTETPGIYKRGYDRNNYGSRTSARYDGNQRPSYNSPPYNNRPPYDREPHNRNPRYPQDNDQGRPPPPPRYPDRERYGEGVYRGRATTASPWFKWPFGKILKRAARQVQNIGNATYQRSLLKQQIEHAKLKHKKLDEDLQLPKSDD